ncbi:MAG: ABC transporter substrate-binding protein [Desulfomonile tiedjei]|uniref:ABC transporter substrate-binding protein n=1 Tax=Desulfomonile tiedjei TaxID=2358 RepID=A0A9D6V1T0_9BACT|nr:ABC transporter substrate-binding protein [Desulfomonile tiedjei]
MARGYLMAALAVFAAFSLCTNAIAVDEIKIGVLYPLTGGAAAEGKELRDGAELAVEIANNVKTELDMAMAKNSGIKSLGGAKIKLIIQDHQGNPQLGADLAKKLIQDDKVVGLMGAYHSAVTKTVAAVAERYGVPMINESSTSPALTKEGLKWFWRTTPHDGTFTNDLFLFLQGLTQGKVRGVKPFDKKELLPIVSACEKTEWGSNVDAAIKEIGKPSGLEPQISLLYAAKAPDLSSEGQSLLSVKPATMLFAGYGADAILMIKTLKSLKAKPKLIWGQNAGFESPEFVSALGEDTEGILTRTVFSPRVGEVKKVSAQVNNLYKTKTGRDLSGASARAFTATQAWVHILEKAGSTKPQDLQKAANEVKIDADELIVPWQGIKFTTTGPDLGQNVLGTGMIGQYQKGKDGKMILEIVYPFELATADMIFPIKGW